jgi:Zn finger protein HypA/HybF involved in hydrogenase expression
MKRLLRKAENINMDDSHIKVDEENIEDMSTFIQLDQLSEADVRHERCPVCKYHPLKRDEGFKTCPRCEKQYKVLDGKGYLIPEQK